MPSTMGKCKLFRIKYITLLEGKTFLRNKHDILFFEIKCTFFARKENTISGLLHKKIYSYLYIVASNTFATQNYIFIFFLPLNSVVKLCYERVIIIHTCYTVFLIAIGLKKSQAYKCTCEYNMM